MKKFLPLLKRINKFGKKEKSQYVKRCNREFIDCISECAKNVLQGNVPLSPRQKGELRRNRQNLRALSIKKTSLKKKRFSGCHSDTDIVSSRWIAWRTLMQHAKKLVIVDPKFLEQLQADTEYKQIQRPADALAKTSLSLDISRIPRDDSVPEDTKAKLYQDALRRYHNVRSEILPKIKVEANPLNPLPQAPPLPPHLVRPPPPPPVPPPPAVHHPRTRGPRLLTRRYHQPKRVRRPPTTTIPWVTF